MRCTWCVWAYSGYCGQMRPAASARPPSAPICVAFLLLHSQPAFCHGASLQEEIVAAYEAAAASGAYDSSCYMMANASEYWAEGTQAWFDATVREGASSWVVDVLAGWGRMERCVRVQPAFLPEGAGCPPLPRTSVALFRLLTSRCDQRHQHPGEAEAA